VPPIGGSRRVRARSAAAPLLAEENGHGDALGGEVAGLGHRADVVEVGEARVEARQPHQAGDHVGREARAEQALLRFRGGAQDVAQERHLPLRMGDLDPGKHGREQVHHRDRAQPARLASTDDTGAAAHGAPVRGAARTNATVSWSDGPCTHNNFRSPLGSGRSAG
jgi:hypothetical protein